MTDKQGSSDVARVCDLRDNFREQGDWPKPGPCELDAAKDADALTRVLAEREADQEALGVCREALEAIASKDLATKPHGEYVTWKWDCEIAREALDRAARSGEGR